MKALFVHDHPFVKNLDTGQIYTSGNLNSELWERYLKHFDTLTVIGRCSTTRDTSKYNLAERANVNFDLFFDIKGGKDYFLRKKYIKHKLASQIAKHDIIILRFPSIISMFAAECCIKNKVKYVAEIVGCTWDANWNYGGILPKILAPYTYFQMKDKVKDAVGAIYVTEKFLQERYPTNGEITSYASNVVIKEVEEKILENRLSRINSDRSHNEFHIGIIGNIAVKYKGYDVLLKAISILPRDIKSRVRISFVGGGDSSYLKSVIRKHNLAAQSHIKGKLKPGAEIFQFIDELDLYIHPSKQEGLPRSVIEAMSRSCPILASSIAGIPELIDGNFLHKPGDYKKLSKDIIKLVENKTIREDAAKANFSRSKNYLFSQLETRRVRFFEAVKAAI